MATRTPAATLEHANLIITVNGNIADNSREKFTAWLLSDLQTPATALQTLLNSVSVAEGTREVSQADYNEALTEGAELVSDVNSYLKGLPRKRVNRDAMKTHYGIGRAMNGNFTHPQIISLLRGFLAANGTAPAVAKLRADLLIDIRATLNIIDAKRPGATTGLRQEEIDARNEQWALLEDSISRAWHFLCAALPDGVFDPGLSRYGFTPRQKPQPSATEEPAAPAPIA